MQYNLLLEPVLPQIWHGRRLALSSVRLARHARASIYWSVGVAFGRS